MKAFTCLAIFIALFGSVKISFGNTSHSRPLAGFQLLMTLEQQKRTERITAALDIDLEKFYDALDQFLYDNSGNEKIKRKSNTLDNTSKETIIKLAHQVANDFDELSESFKSVYFVGGDGGLKERFDLIKKYRQNLTATTKATDVDFLYSLHTQSQRAKSDVKDIKYLVKHAGIETEEYIRKMIKKMSLWEWLFGY